ncbi:MAG: tetratricopeptide repeat protein [Kofleriaceae bacterium]|nr:tetratricopeptide repeat protein [Kofleriaceae bacterium]
MTGYLLQNGFLEDALPVLEALDGMLDDAELAYSHGLCLSELGRPAEAVAPLQRAVELDPTHANAFIALGVAFARTGRADEAANALRDAVKLEPENAFAKRNLAAVLMRSAPGGRGAAVLPPGGQSGAGRSGGAARPGAVPGRARAVAREGGGRAVQGGAQALPRSPGWRDGRGGAHAHRA